MKIKPIQLELPFDDSIESVNADLNSYYEKVTLAELNEAIVDYQDQVYDWPSHYE